MRESEKVIMGAYRVLKGQVKNILENEAEFILNSFESGSNHQEIAEDLSRKYSPIKIDRRRIGDFIKRAEEIENNGEEPEDEEWDDTVNDNHVLLDGLSKAYRILKKEGQLSDIPYTRRRFNEEDDQNILILTDLHVGQIVHRKDVGGQNKYNYQILENRLSRLGSFVRQLKNKNKLHIVTLGDLVHGELYHHQDFTKSMEFDVITQTLKAAHLITEFIGDLLGTFTRIDAYSVIGNHGRLPHKRTMPNIDAGASFDWLVMDYVQTNLAKNFRRFQIVNERSENLVFNIENLDIALTHGHRLGTGSQGVREKMFTKFSMLRSKDRKFVDMLLHGHFHHNTMTEFSHGMVQVGGGSTVGADPYAANSLLSTSRPSQTLVRLVRNDRGELEFGGTTPFYLDD